MKTLKSFLLFLMFIASALPASAQKDPTPLRVEDSLSALSFGFSTPVILSSDGEWVAYTLQDARKKKTTTDRRYQIISRTGAPDVLLGCDIWITNTKSGESKNLTNGQGTNWAPSWSPDGNYLAFFSDRNGKANLWIWERSSGRVRQVSDATVRISLLLDVPRWTPDGRKIAIKVLPEKMTIDDLADLYFSAPKQTNNQDDSAGSTVIVYSSPATSKETKAAQPHQESAETKSQTGRMLADLALIDVSSGAMQRIARGYKPAGYWISPDGSHLAFTTLQGFAAGNPIRRLYDLVVISLTDARTRVLASNIQQFLGLTVSWSPDGTLLSYTEWGTQVKGDCFIVALKSGELRKATQSAHPSFGAVFRAPLWDAAGQSLYFLTSNSLWKVSVADGTATELAKIPNRNLIEVVSPADVGRFWAIDNGKSMVITTCDDGTKQVGFYKVDLITGKVAKLLEENKYYGQFKADTSVDGQHVIYIAQDAQNGEDIWIVNTDFRSPRRLTHINPHLDRYLFGSSRLVEWRSADGVRLQGALLLPPGYTEGKRSPLIVCLYGGKSMSDQVNQFGLHGDGVNNMQLLTTRGYAVLLPDSPLQVGTPMQDLAKTVLPGVDKVIDIGIADPDRLGIMGRSYGGYSTLALVTQTTRFKAAIMRSGVGNLIGMYGLLEKDGSAINVIWAEEDQGRLGGTPWQFRDRYIENSPIFYLDKITTPLLITHGGADRRIPPFLAEEIFVGLRRLGKEVVYAKYEGEDHLESTWGYANQVNYMNRVITWFNKYLNSAP